MFHNKILKIIVLNITVTFNLLVYVEPLCLPYDDSKSEDYHFNTLGNKLGAVVSGWGATDARGNNCTYCNMLH
jgi:hypothetical protein